MKVSMSHLKDGLIWSMVIFFISAPICLWATGDIKIAVFAGGAYILLIMIPATIGNLDFDRNMVPVIENLVKKEHRIILYGGGRVLKANRIWENLALGKNGYIPGVWFVLERQLYFREMKLDNPYEQRFSYREIESVQKYSPFSKYLMIQLKNGQSSLIEVSQRGIWITKINECIKRSGREETCTRITTSYGKDFMMHFLSAFAIGVIIFGAIFRNRTSMIVAGVIAVIFATSWAVAQVIHETYRIPLIKGAIEEKYTLYGGASLIGRKNLWNVISDRKKEKRRGGLFLQKQGIQFCNLTEDRMEKLFSYKIPYEDIASVRTYVPMTRLVQIQLKSGEIKIFAVNKRKIWVYEIEQKMKKGW